MSTEMVSVGPHNLSTPVHCCHPLSTHKPLNIDPLVQTILLLRIKKEEKTMAILQINSLIPFSLGFFTVLQLENGIALFIGYYWKAYKMELDSSV